MSDKISGSSKKSLRGLDFLNLLLADVPRSSLERW